MERRTFLKATAAAAMGAVLRLPRLSRMATPPRRHKSVSAPTAQWVIEENRRKGTTAWAIEAPQPDPPGIEGYLDRDSVQAGDEAKLHVSTVSRSFHVEVYRMGYYGGRGARLVEQLGPFRGSVQPPPSFTRGVNMIECHWRPASTIRVGHRWPPGNYLLKLVSSEGYERYVPFLVRDDSSKAAFVVQSSVTTWQAYNLWGGYSLYGGTPLPGTSEYDSRSRIVSFDRPYGPNLDANGSGDWLGNEYPLVYFMERHGLDVTYWTDLDFHARPHLLDAHRCLISLGHDEYWSLAMRKAAEDAVHEGVNLVFLGANACFRQIRVESSPTGQYRRVICYKDASEDPVMKTDPALATAFCWASPPDPRPESALVGLMYRSYEGTGPLVVVDGGAWVFEGTGLRDGSRVPAVIGSEFDGYDPRLPGPTNMQILAHSPTSSVSGPSASDMGYYTVDDGGGVFASGTASFVTCMWDGTRILANALHFGVTPAAKPLGAIAYNVFKVFGREPASRAHPSKSNWRTVYPSLASVPPSDAAE